MVISIITVCFNSAETIADTIRSVADQSHPDIEHIVIDGGSKDDTVNIVKSMDTRIARIVSEPDNGIYEAMNKGLLMATGEFVGFLNADDMLATSDTMARIAGEGSKGADAVYGDLVYVDKDRPDKVIRYWNSGLFSKEKLRYGWMPPHPTLYVRRSVQQGLGPFDTRLRISADYDFMLRCLSQPKLSVRYLPQVLVRMRTGGASNRSLKALRNKSREDLFALRKSGIGGWITLLCKNGRKLPQFLKRPPAQI